MERDKKDDEGEGWGSAIVDFLVGLLFFWVD